MSDLQLMEDYFSILEQCQDPDEVFKDSPMENTFASAWLLKLCNEIYRRKEEKQSRNLYLMELSKCIKQGKLNKLFMSIPPKGKLQPFESSLKIEIDPRTIIDEMQATAAELIPQVSPRNYQSHMSTKIFDDNQGACAYLAVSLADPKDGPIWLKMGNKEPFIQENVKYERLLEECGDDFGDGDDDIDFLVFCLDETAKQLGGLAEPGDCPFLEEQLALYEPFFKNYDIGNAASKMNKREWRTFLLMNFQTDLLHALERYQ